MTNGPFSMIMWAEAKWWNSRRRPHGRRGSVRGAQSGWLVLRRARVVPYALSSVTPGHCRNARWELRTLEMTRTQNSEGMSYLEARDKAETAVIADTDHGGRHRKASPMPSLVVRLYVIMLACMKSYTRSLPALRRKLGSSRRSRTSRTGVVVVCAAAITAAVIAAVSIVHGNSAHGSLNNPAVLPPSDSRPMPGSYIGVYAAGVPQSYAGIRTFSAITGVKPGVAVYYSGWLEPFQSQFAATVVREHAVPLVQIDPTGINLEAIASGRYDSYLRSYAYAVKKFGRQVILSFGHEMNGSWYSWGSGQTPPAVFVAAWRHIVTVFRAIGARNVIWLWTINIVGCRCQRESPARWWPGGSYVDWVGIDGYYYKPSWKFAPLFGPTIKAVRALTLDPILISETAAPASTQPSKIPDLFAGIRAYGLLGFVWFDVNRHKDWRISSRAASAAFRQGAATLRRSAP